LEILGKMQGIDIFDMKPLDASRTGMDICSVNGGLDGDFSKGRRRGRRDKELIEGFRYTKGTNYG
jgi:hypothetical protein